MTKTRSLLMMMLAAGPAALGGLALAAQDRYSLQVPGGLAFCRLPRIRRLAGHRRQSQRRQARNDPRQSRDDRGLQGGHSRQRQAFPRRRAGWRRSIGRRRRTESQPGEPIVPGALHDVDFMVKDSKKFADSGGWGYAQFEYDPASETFRPGDTNRLAAAGARRQMRLRLPHDRGGQGLRVHRLSEAVRAAQAAVVVASPSGARAWRSRGTAPPTRQPWIASPGPQTRGRDDVIG